MDGVEIINIYFIRIPAGLAAHVNCAAHKEIVIKNIRNVPLKNAFHLLGRVVIIRKFPDIVNGCGKDFYHPLLNLSGGKPALSLAGSRNAHIHRIFAAHGVDFFRHVSDST